eukprot:587432_1
MAKRARSSFESTPETSTSPHKKRKIAPIKEIQFIRLNAFIKTCSKQSTPAFLKQYTSKHLSTVICDHCSLNPAEKDYPFVYLESRNQWKNRNKLSKSEKIKYITQQLVHPLQYLLAQFDTKHIHKSLHFEYFLKGKLTSTMRWSKRSQFWVSSASKSAKPRYWKQNDAFLSRTIHSVCHFIQKECGTGVHIGNGYVLSCCHVIVSDTDDDKDHIKRIGRIKYILFANGIIYSAKCIAFNEEWDLSLSQINFDSRIDVKAELDESDADDNEYEKEDKVEIGSAVLSPEVPQLKCDLFCVGNPSNINLESSGKRCNDFDPKVFHLSFGKLETENNTSDELGGYGHSCWTYWGHSGAPIFNRSGQIVAIHNSWNDQTGLRHAVKLKHIKEFVNKHVSTYTTNDRTATNMQ